MGPQDTSAAASERYAPPASLDRYARVSLVVGLVAALASGAGALLDTSQFYRSYLVGYLWILAFPMGSLAILMLHHLTKGAWGVVIRRIFEAATRTLPLLVLLFVPLALGLRELFVWADPEVVAHDPILQGKSAYLNPSFFLLRAAGFFLLWWGLGLLLNRLSARQDLSGDPRLSLRMQVVSGVGVLLYVLTATFAAVDWLMSLDPHWFSSIYGIYFVGGHALTGLAFAVPMALLLGRERPMSEVLQRGHFHDYGKLMLAFIMLWAYFSLSQFIITWSGNLPEEVPWYLERTKGPWRIVSQVVVFLHFVLPFLMLLSTNLKRDAKRLASVAVLLLAMRWVDLYWQAAPALHAERLHWLDLALPLAMGGLWLAFFFWQLRRRPLVPLQEPYLKEALNHG